MGAIPYSDRSEGVTFRVWAPCAQAVAVAGDFNGWSVLASPLFAEGNGYWSVDVSEAAVDQSYKFVVTSQVGASLWRMDPYARQIVHDPAHNLNGVVAASQTAYDVPGYSTPKWNELVIYELHARTFVYGGGYENTGSFESIATKLDYLRDLGINAIELMPLGEFIGDVSAGYNPAYIFAIEDEFGGPDGFRAFVNAAHQRGIAVIVDVVYNHLGDSAGDMWQFDGWSLYPDKGGVYFYNDWRSETAWGQTRFDYGRGEVRQYLRDNALRWLEERFADGIRWDSVGSIRNAKDLDNLPFYDIPDGYGLCQWINGEIAGRQPWKISIAEDMKDNEWITRTAGAGGAGFNAQWSARFVGTLRANLIAADDGSRDMGAVAAALSQAYNGDAFQRVIFTESHDADSNGAQRVPEMIWPGNATSWHSKKRSTLGAAAVMTAPGIPMLFMGQEFLCGGWFSPDAELDWTNASTFPGIITLHRDLIRLRRNWFDDTRGLRGQKMNVHHVNDTDKVIAFHRWDQGGHRDDVVVVLNFGHQAHSSYALGFPGGGLWRVRFNSDASAYDGSFQDWDGYDTEANGAARDNMPVSANIGIGAYSALILSQD
jgi:1,4-alpha-glucan branching enzyme